jgi:predicted CoA-binding protein
MSKTLDSKHIRSVVVLGASAKVERYSYKALKKLLEEGYKVFPVNPAQGEIDGIKVYQNLREIKDRIDTITVYLSEERSSALEADILCANPKRVIFNPGAENPELAKTLKSQGIEILDACTLVMLSTETF